MAIGVESHCPSKWHNEYGQSGSSYCCCDENFHSHDSEILYGVPKDLAGRECGHLGQIVVLQTTVRGGLKRGLNCDFLHRKRRNFFSHRNLNSKGINSFPFSREISQLLSWAQKGCRSFDRQPFLFFPATPSPFDTPPRATATQGNKIDWEHCTASATAGTAGHPLPTESTVSIWISG